MPIPTSNKNKLTFMKCHDVIYVTVKTGSIKGTVTQAKNRVIQGTREPCLNRSTWDVSHKNGCTKIHLVHLQVSAVMSTKFHGNPYKTVVDQPTNNPIKHLYNDPSINPLQTSPVRV